jgi:hypothetical protein
VESGIEEPKRVTHLPAGDCLTLLGNRIPDS